MNSVSRNPMRHVAVILLMGAMLWPAGGQVLCIGDDGHVAVESPHPLGACDHGGLVDGGHHQSSEIHVVDSDCMDIHLAPQLLIRPGQDQQIVELFTAHIDLVLDHVDLNAVLRLRDAHLNGMHHLDRDSQRSLSLCSSILLL